MIILSMCIKVCHLVILYLANFYTRMLFAKKSPQNPQPCKLSLFCQIGFEARNIVGVDGSHEKNECASRQCLQKALYPYIPSSAANTSGQKWASASSLTSEDKG
jgi:hypothetical protein